MAHTAQRNADRVQARAVEAAAQVQQAAASAAAALARLTSPGEERQAAFTAALLANTVEAAVEATSQDTRRAAVSTAAEVAEAAAHVATVVAAADNAAEQEAQSTAVALRKVTTAVTEQMLAETQAHAAVVAVAAREAAEALQTPDPRASRSSVPARDGRALVEGDITTFARRSDRGAKRFHWRDAPAGTPTAPHRKDPPPERREVLRTLVEASLPVMSPTHRPGFGGSSRSPRPSMTSPSPSHRRRTRLCDLPRSAAWDAAAENFSLRTDP